MRSDRLAVHERLPLLENGKRQLLTGGYLSSSGHQRLWEPLSLLASFVLIPCCTYLRIPKIIVC